MFSHSTYQANHAILLSSRVLTESDADQIGWFNAVNQQGYLKAIRSSQAILLTNRIDEQSEADPGLMAKSVADQTKPVYLQD